MRNGLPGATGKPFPHQEYSPNIPFTVHTTIKHHRVDSHWRRYRNSSDLHVIADSIPHVTRIDNMFVDDGCLLLGAPRSHFYRSVTPHFLVAVLRSSMLFTTQAPRTL